MRQKAGILASKRGGPCGNPLTIWVPGLVTCLPGDEGRNRKERAHLTGKSSWTGDSSWLYLLLRLKPGLVLPQCHRKARRARASMRAAGSCYQTGSSWTQCLGAFSFEALHLFPRLGGNDIIFNLNPFSYRFTE